MIIPVHFHHLGKWIILLRLSDCLPRVCRAKLHFPFTLTGLPCSTAHCQYLTWNEQVECDQSSLFFSLFDWIWSSVLGSSLQHLNCAEISAGSSVNEALWYKYWTFCSLSNSPCSSGYISNITPWRVSLGVGSLVVNRQEQITTLLQQSYNISEALYHGFNYYFMTDIMEGNKFQHLENVFGYNDSHTHTHSNFRLWSWATCFVLLDKECFIIVNYPCYAQLDSNVMFAMPGFVLSGPH